MQSRPNFPHHFFHFPTIAQDVELAGSWGGLSRGLGVVQRGVTEKRGAVIDDIQIRNSLRLDRWVEWIFMSMAKTWVSTMTMMVMTGSRAKDRRTSLLLIVISLGN